jgi:hypothetical protein
LALVFTVAVVVACVWADFKLWQIEHPGSPDWVYFVRGK